MPRRKRTVPATLKPTCSMLPRSCAPLLAFPALREAVKAWVAGGYKGITDTTRILLNHWFHTDHKLPTGSPFNYHRSQQEAIETLIFVWEFEKVRTRKGLLERYATDLQTCACRPTMTLPGTASRWRRAAARRK